MMFLLGSCQSNVNLNSFSKKKKILALKLNKNTLRNYEKKRFKNIFIAKVFEYMILSQEILDGKYSLVFFFFRGIFISFNLITSYYCNMLWSGGSAYEVKLILINNN